MTIIKTGFLAASLLAGSAALASAAPAVVSNDLNLRAGPGTGYGVVAVMPAGSTVDTIGCTGNWCRVSYGGVVGYASASYLDGRGAYAAAPRAVYVAPPVLRPRVYYGHGPRWQHRNNWRHHRYHHRSRHWR
jgi:uncharacterized protein YraI